MASSEGGWQGASGARDARDGEQELMRHANIFTTMNVYTKALTPAKREAQSRAVDVLTDRSRKVVENAAEDAA
jgi:hypothetical protein